MFYRRSVVLVAILLLAGLWTSASAAVLYFEDFTHSTDVIAGALAIAGKTGVMATSTADFITKLTTGGPWELVIFGEQDTPIFSTNAALATALTNYVNGGGRLIASTFTPLSGLAALCQATEVGTNASPITTNGNPIFGGVGPTIVITNTTPPWGTFDLFYAPTGSAVGIGTLGTGNAVILGNNGRTLLNGPLFDTYATVSQGQQFVADEITVVANASAPTTSTSVPAASVWSLLAMGVLLAGAAMLMLRRRTTAC